MAHHRCLHRQVYDEDESGSNLSYDSRSSYSQASHSDHSSEYSRSNRSRPAEESYRGRHSHSDNRRGRHGRPSEEVSCDDSDGVTCYSDTSSQSGITCTTPTSSVPAGRDTRRPQATRYRETEEISPDSIPVAYAVGVKPLNHVRGEENNGDSQILIRMRRWNKTVTISWEGFTGLMGASGTATLNVVGRIDNLPPHQIVMPIAVTFKSVFGGPGWIVINPQEHKDPSDIQFVISNDPKLINYDDSVRVHGGSVSWIVDGARTWADNHRRN